MLTQTCTAVNFTADNDFVTASIGVDILKGVMRGGFINFFYNLGKDFSGEWMGMEHGCGNR